MANNGITELATKRIRELTEIDSLQGFLPLDSPTIGTRKFAANKLALKAEVNAEFANIHTTLTKQSTRLTNLSTDVETLSRKVAGALHFIGSATTTSIGRLTTQENGDMYSCENSGEIEYYHPRTATIKRLKVKAYDEVAWSDEGGWFKVGTDRDFDDFITAEQLAAYNFVNQDDLATFRAGLATVARTNQYSDLSGIPTGVLTFKVGGTTLGTFNGNANAEFAVPNIPTKLSELQNDAGYTTNTGTVTGVKINGSLYNPTSGTVDLGSDFEKDTKRVSAENISAEVFRTDGYYPSVAAMLAELAKYQLAIQDLGEIRSGASAGATAVQPAALSRTLEGYQTLIQDLQDIRSGATLGATAVQPADLDGYQPLIQDLEDIRSGASLGATAVQPEVLQGYQLAIQDLEDIRSGASAGATAVQPADLPTYSAPLFKNDSNVVGLRYGTGLKLGGSNNDTLVSNGSAHYLLLGNETEGNIYIYDMERPKAEPVADDPGQGYEKVLVADIVEGLRNKENFVLVIKEDDGDRKKEQRLNLKYADYEATEDENLYDMYLDFSSVTPYDTDYMTAEGINCWAEMAESAESHEDELTGYLIVDEFKESEIESLPGREGASEGDVLTIDSDGNPVWASGGAGGSKAIHFVYGAADGYLYDLEVPDETSWCGYAKLAFDTILAEVQAGKLLVDRQSGGGSSEGNYRMLRRFQYNSSTGEFALFFEGLVTSCGTNYADYPNVSAVNSNLFIYDREKVSGSFTNYLKLRGTGQGSMASIELQKALIIAANSGLTLGPDGRTLSVDTQSVEVIVNEEVKDAISAVQSRILYTVDLGAVTGECLYCNGASYANGMWWQGTLFSPNMDMEIDENSTICFGVTSDHSQNSNSSEPYKFYLSIYELTLTYNNNTLGCTMKWFGNTDDLFSLVSTKGLKFTKFSDLMAIAPGETRRLRSDKLYYVMVCTNYSNLKLLGSANHSKNNCMPYMTGQYNPSSHSGSSEFSHSSFKDYFNEVTLGNGNFIERGKEDSGVGSLFVAFTNINIGQSAAVNGPFEIFDDPSLAYPFVSSFIDSSFAAVEVFQKIKPMDNCTITKWAIIDNVATPPSNKTMGKVFRVSDFNVLHSDDDPSNPTGSMTTYTLEDGLYKHVYTPTTPLTLTANTQYYFPFCSYLSGNRTEKLAKYQGRGTAREIVFWTSQNNSYTVYSNTGGYIYFEGSYTSGGSTQTFSGAV